MIRYPKLIGITGGIGSGKTHICKIFSCLGIPVYNADSRARWLMEHDEPLKISIIDLFGKEVYNPAGNFNSGHVAKKVFENDFLLQKLNGLVHPKVASDFNDWVDINSNSAYVLKEAALLFESGSYKTLDSIILVSAPLDIRINRIKIRDPFRTELQINAIMDKQLPEERKMEMANDIIFNDEKSLIIPQVLKLHQQLTK